MVWSWSLGNRVPVGIVRVGDPHDARIGPAWPGAHGDEVVAVVFRWHLDADSPPADMGRQRIDGEGMSGKHRGTVPGAQENTGQPGRARRWSRCRARSAPCPRPNRVPPARTVRAKPLPSGYSAHARPWPPGSRDLRLRAHAQRVLVGGQLDDGLLDQETHLPRQLRNRLAGLVGGEMARMYCGGVFGEAHGRFPPRRSSSPFRPPSGRCARIGAQHLDGTRRSARSTASVIALLDPLGSP
jgi:hypothetical protein